MATTILSIKTNPTTGQPELKIELVGDQSALPHEHEAHHRRILSQLGLKPADLNRDAPQPIASQPNGPVARPTPTANKG